MQPTTLEILSIHNPADYGEDIPWEYTARLVSGTAADAVAVLEEGLGREEKFEPYGIEVKGDIIHFQCFESARIGEVFSIRTTLALALQEAKEAAVVTNELDRLTDKALIELFPPKPMWTRVYYWERLHPDADAPIMHDAAGRPIEAAGCCRFNHPHTGEVMLGRIRDIRADPVRPIAVYEMTRIVTGGHGCYPSDLAMIEDSPHIARLYETVKARVRRRIADDDMVCLNQDIRTDPDLRALAYAGIAELLREAGPANAD